MKRLAEGVGVLLPGTLLAIVLLVAGDLQRLVPASARFMSGATDVLAVALTLCGLYALSLGIVLAVLAGLLALLGPAELHQFPSNLREGLRDRLLGRHGEPGRGARELSALAGLGVFLVAGVRLSQYFVESFNTPRLVAASVTLSLLVLALLCVVLGAVLASLLTRLARGPALAVVVHARTSVVLVLLGGVLLAVFAVVEERTLFKEIDGWRLYLPVAALGVLATCTALMPARLARRLTPRVTVIWLVAGGALAALLVVGLAVAPFDVRARALLSTSGRTASQLLSFWSDRFDLDGDGVPWLLGGGDCDAWDPFVYPGAVDIPDNGIDEDCFDGDLQAPPPLAAAAPAEPVPLTVSRPDIILFSIDGCRRDALGVYGAGQERTPNLDAFARQAVVLDDAVSPSSWTMPSFVSMFSSRFTSELPRFFSAVRATQVPADLPLLQTPFASAGYRTVAITAGLQLDKLGLDRDFGEWRALTRDPKGSFAQAVSEAGSEVLRAAPLTQPLLLWMHVVDAHFPYEAPAAHRLFGTDRRSQYAAELHYVDAAFTTVLQAIADSGRAQRAIVMVFADHGESFGEHGIEFHGHTTYAEETRVPWMVRIPGVTPRRVPDLVGLIDLAPTLWQLAGLDVRTPVRGRSLAPLLVQGTPLAERSLLLEQTRYTRDFSLLTSPYQLHYDQTRNYIELFDRTADPAQTTNLAEQLPHRVIELRRELNRRMAPIAYIAGKQLGSVLLRTVPATYQKVSARFEGGPRIEAVHLNPLSPRRVDVDVVLTSDGPFEGGKFEIEVAIQNKDSKRLGANRKETTDGVYLPARWRPGDHVQHHSSLNLSQDLPTDGQVCIAFLIDKVPRSAAEGAAQLCLPVASDTTAASKDASP